MMGILLSSGDGRWWLWRLFNSNKNFKRETICKSGILYGTLTNMKDEMYLNDEWLGNW